MGKEKIVQETTKSTLSTANNMILQYAPLIIGLICLVICYLLYKKIQTLNLQGNGISKIEKQFTNFVKEQSELNTINSKKLNSVISQVNQLSYIIQNIHIRETNSMDSQMSPEREINQAPEETPQEASQEVLQDTQHKQQREMMPTSVIQTNFPIKSVEQLPIPVITTNKKEIEQKENLKILQQQQEQNKKSSKKKVIDLQKFKSEEILIEEAVTSDED